nr:unnamed protein product [Digitaria exilis]
MAARSQRPLRHGRRLSSSPPQFSSVIAPEPPPSSAVHRQKKPLRSECFLSREYVISLSLSLNDLCFGLASPSLFPGSSTSSYLWLGCARRRFIRLGARQLTTRTRAGFPSFTRRARERRAETETAVSPGAHVPPRVNHPSHRASLRVNPEAGTRPTWTGRRSWSRDGWGRVWGPARRELRASRGWRRPPGHVLQIRLGHDATRSILFLGSGLSTPSGSRKEGRRMIVIVRARTMTVLEHFDARPRL